MAIAHGMLYGVVDPSAGCCGNTGYVPITSSSPRHPSRCKWRSGRPRQSDREPPSLEIHMAKGQKRSNREVKKPKKTAAERAKTSVMPAMGGLGKGAVA